MGVERHDELMGFDPARPRGQERTAGAPKAEVERVLPYHPPEEHAPALARAAEIRRREKVVERGRRGREVDAPGLPIGENPRKPVAEVGCVRFHSGDEVSAERAVKFPAPGEERPEEHEIFADVEPMDEASRDVPPGRFAGCRSERADPFRGPKTEPGDPDEEVFDGATDLDDVSVSEDRGKEGDGFLIPGIGEAVGKFEGIGREKSALIVFRKEGFERGAKSVRSRRISDANDAPLPRTDRDFRIVFRGV